MAYTLQITVVSGSHLPSADLNGYSDPYCKIFWGGNMAKTSVKKKTLNPYWNETFSLSSSNYNDEVKISCFDHDRFTRDDVLGGGSISTYGLVNSVEKTQVIHLTPRGDITVKLKPINFPNQQQSIPTNHTTTTTIYTTGGAPSMTVDDMVRQRFASTRPPATNTNYYYGSNGVPMTGAMPMTGMPVYQPQPVPYGSGGYPMSGGIPAYPPTQGFAAPAPGYMTPPSTGYGAPPQAGYGQPQTGFAAPNYGTQPVYNTPPMSGGIPAYPPTQGFAAPAPGYMTPPSTGYGAPPTGYGAPPTGYGAPPQAGYGQPQTGFAAPGSTYPPRY